MALRASGTLIAIERDLRRTGAKLARL